MTHRVLIIGCGAIAGGYDAPRSPGEWPLSHAGAITRDPRFKLAACVDPDDQAREAFARRWTVPQSAPSLEALSPQVGAFDVIVIASPTSRHAQHLRAARALKPQLVFCEKPIAADLETAKREVAAYRQAGIALAVNHTRRWAPDLVELARNWPRLWGEPVSAVGTYAKGVLHNGGHLIDLVQMILGKHQLHGAGPAIYDHDRADPSVHAVLSHPTRGSSVHLVAGDCRAFTQFELVLTFERGEVAIRDAGLRMETRRLVESPLAAGYRQLGPVESAPGRYREAMSAAYANIAETIASGAPLACDAEHALAAHALCEEIRQAALQTSSMEPAQ